MSEDDGAKTLSAECVWAGHRQYIASAIQRVANNLQEKGLEHADVQAMGAALIVSEIVAFIQLLPAPETRPAPVLSLSSVQ